MQVCRSVYVRRAISGDAALAHEPVRRRVSLHGRGSTPPRRRARPVRTASRPAGRLSRHPGVISFEFAEPAGGPPRVAFFASPLRRRWSRVTAQAETRSRRRPSRRARRPCSQRSWRGRAWSSLGAPARSVLLPQIRPPDPWSARPGLAGRRVCCHGGVTGSVLSRRAGEAVRARCVRRGGGLTRRRKRHVTLRRVSPAGGLPSDVSVTARRRVGWTDTRLLFAQVPHVVVAHVGSLEHPTGRVVSD